MTTAEGGMAVTDDDEAARLLRILRSHGMTSLTWDRHRGHNFSYDVIATGLNYRIDEIRAALGRVQLDKLNEHNRRRREISKEMRSLLSGIEGISVPFRGSDLDSSSCHIFPVLLESPELRQSFMRSMKDRGIQTSVHYPPVHTFSDFEHYAPCTLPLTEEVAGREVTLPLFPTMTAEQMTLLCNATEVCLRGLEPNKVRQYAGEKTLPGDSPAALPNIARR
jgi:dTDP-4-amino-4,6-dideoxygalactose transaminase